MPIMSQDRVPPTAPADLHSAQKTAHDFLVSSLQAYFGPSLNDTFKTQNDDGALIGPLATLVKYPSLAKPYFELLGAIAQLADLTPDVREIAILTVGGVYKCGYELYSHERVAAAKTSLSQDVISSLAKGEKPDGLTEQCQAAYELSYALAEKKGPLDQEVFDKAKGALGQDGVVAITNYVGIYAYTCIVLNAVDASVPQD